MSLSGEANKNAGVQLTEKAMKGRMLLIPDTHFFKVFSPNNLGPPGDGTGCGKTQPSSLKPDTKEMRRNAD